MALGDITLINNKEYIDLTPKMTSNNSPSPYEVSGTNLNSGGSFYQAFDVDPMTYYRSSIQFTTGSMQMYFGKEVICNCYTLSAGNTAWTMKDWVFQGSKDGSVWDTLHTVKDMTLWIDATTPYTYEFENDTAYSYYRIYCSAKNGGNSICIGEWKFYERRNTTMTFHKVLEKNVPNTVMSENDAIYFTDDGNIYISKKDGTLMRVGGSGGGDSLKRIKLDILTDGQTEFETTIIPIIPINEMVFYLVVNNSIYIEEINVTLDSYGKALVTFDNINFNLEINDVVYLLYTEGNKKSGGFESVVLFDGHANTVNASYLLTDNIDKFDFLYIETCVYFTDTSDYRLLQPITISVPSIVYNSVGQLAYSHCESATIIRCLSYEFTDSNTLMIDTRTDYGTGEPCIKKIVGIKR